jgi:formiminoglutamase
MTCKWCLIGVPDHQGVVIVGGRIGSAAGPAAFRRHLQRFMSERPVQEHFIDAGDVEKLTANIEKNHLRTAEKVHASHRECQFSVVVGGGHDHGYSHLLGIQRHLQETLGPKGRLGCINIDAHLDVRAPAMWKGKLTPSSGSPFYLAITQKILAPECFVEFGIQTHANGPELWDFARTQGIQVIPFEKLRFGEAIVYFREALLRLASRCDRIVVSLDLDAAAEAFAPGVSAPQAEGFTSSELMQMLEEAGREPKVLSLGIFELNPEVDQGEKTSRLAATLAYHFAHAKLFGLS